MLTSIGLIFVLGALVTALLKKINVPHIIGLLVLGMAISSLLDPSLIAISPQIRQIALVVILIKAGLSLNLADLKQVGRPAVLMSFVPALFEMATVVVLATFLFDMPVINGVVLASVLAAVSPAIIVPQMIYLIENGYGTKKSIPQLILASCAIDDIFVIILFSCFTDLAQGGSVSVADFMDIPISIITGIVLGYALGFAIAFVLKRYPKTPIITLLIVIMGSSLLLLGVEELLSDVVALSGLLAIMCSAVAYKRYTQRQTVSELSAKFADLWTGAEMFLFVLVGASVDIAYSLEAGASVIILILVALAVRCVGVQVCLLKTQLNFKERVFCMYSYLPKATVQAGIGAIPLAMGLPYGELILTIAVVGILVSAPLGAILIKANYKNLELE